MARPPLTVGTPGNINTVETTGTDGKPRYRAYARYRGKDGRTRKVERTGTSKAKAIRRLRAALTEYAEDDGEHTLTAASRLELAATAWLASVHGEVAATTYASYERGVRNHIVPALGGLLLRECKTSRLNNYFKQLRANGMSAHYRRSLRYVLHGIMSHAITEDALEHNPVSAMPKITGGNTRPKTTLTVDQLGMFLDILDGDRHTRRADLPDFMRFLLGTGVRYGEALAVRWRDLNLTDSTVTIDGRKVPPQSVWINGNLVEVKGEGVLRHPGKTAAANRMVGLPAFLSSLLLVRRDIDAYDDDPVFPTGMAGWRAPTNVQRAVRNFRERAVRDGGDPAVFANFTTHVSRRTVLTLLDDAGQSPRQIADLAGHARVSMTQDVYMGRGQANPAAAAELDKAHRSS